MDKGFKENLETYLATIYILLFISAVALGAILWKVNHIEKVVLDQQLLIEDKACKRVTYY